MSEETNDFKPLADADDATSQQPVTAAADYPVTALLPVPQRPTTPQPAMPPDRATG